MITINEARETIRMISEANLDVRTITMGINLLDCADSDLKTFCGKIYDKITLRAEHLARTGEDIAREYGVPVINKRISVTPIAIAAAGCRCDDYVEVARAMDRAADAVGVNFIGGFSALVHKGITPEDNKLLDSVPTALAETERVCSSVNVGTTRSGINMDAINITARIIRDSAMMTRDRDSIGCAKFVVFCNAVEDNPFMAGAFHGVGEGDAAINVGVSGPGVVKRAVESARGADFETLCETVKRTAFKITRVGQLVAQEASRRLGVPFGVIDLSLAPTPAAGDSVAEILREMGLEQPGAPGTTAAIAILNDNVKKGGVMASSYVGGLSGAFIPVSE
ncbi:MAG: PFL family protein, partial [Synergistaceae bacterium]|nr:PFL family protein [Synergistaceae bacterium]